MSAVMETMTGISNPADAAIEVARLTNRLAGERTIPADVVDAVREIATAIERTNPSRWEMIDPHHAVIVLHSAVTAQRALDDPRSVTARDQLRIALESIRQSLAAIAEQEPVSDERSPKELMRWLAERTEV